jgi:hypothetical protein
MGKPVNISLTVQAATLYAIEDPTQQDVDDNCQLCDDNNGQSPNNGPIEDFVSTVYTNNFVKWTGDTADQGYSIAIDKIANDSNFFATNPVLGNGGPSGNVRAEVSSTVSSGSIDVYTIGFYIYPPRNGTAKYYSIDPKLQGNT